MTLGLVALTIAGLLNLFELMTDKQCTHDVVMTRLFTARMTLFATFLALAFSFSMMNW